MNYKKNCVLTILLIITTALTGCTHLRKQPPALEYIPWKKRQIELQKIESWTITGALSITHNKKREIAHFKWEQNQNNYTINIAGPLNMNSISIVGNPSNVELCYINKKCIKAKTPEQLILNRLGWQFPISNIRSWILALPMPKTKIHAINFDQYGHVIELKQNGWQIKYYGFNTLAGKKYIDLPQIIELKNSPLAIKLKITNCSI